MTDCTCGSGVRWCARADEIFGVDGVHVVAVSRREDGLLVLDVETDVVLAGCPSCGVVATGHGHGCICCTMRRASAGRCWFAG